MKPEIEEVIKHYIRESSNDIHELKESKKALKEYINPDDKEWAAYVGYKREVSKWLLALHLHRNNKEKLKCHLPKKYPHLVSDANKALFELAEKLRSKSRDQKFFRIGKEIEERREQHEDVCARS